MKKNRTMYIKLCIDIRKCTCVPFISFHLSVFFFQAHKNEYHESWKKIASIENESQRKSRKKAGKQDRVVNKKKENTQ